MKSFKLFIILTFITLSLVFNTRRTSNNSLLKGGEGPKKKKTGNGKQEIVSKWARPADTPAPQQKIIASEKNPNDRFQLTRDDMHRIECAAMEFCLHNSRSDTYFYFTEQFQKKDANVISSTEKWTNVHNQKHIFEVILPATIGSFNFKTEPLIHYTGTPESRMRENAAYLNGLSKIGESSAGDASDIIGIGKRSLDHVLEASSAGDISNSAGEAGLGALGKAIQEFGKLYAYNKMMKQSQKVSASPKVEDTHRCEGSSTNKLNCNDRRRKIKK